MNTLREAYKNMFRGVAEESQAQAGAAEDLFIEDYLRKNPGMGREQARLAYQSYLKKPIKGPNPNSAEFKFGSGNVNLRR
jgi:hypothetical protein